ncbi:Aste57867_1217 [Aphanomyces stellatus]|uniref:Aste57867_1217 protein n=1 Tax=Aphanomyces stellatus TaxID=120398 RepID=A0A485K4M0_9STRA|nr:hypothetical protein As57867_001216 [Aphanomyces stellatus]VFT78437.1 Aste57867_1217 [Aphanomyces stellatus]
MAKASTGPKKRKQASNMVAEDSTKPIADVKKAGKKGAANKAAQEGIEQPVAELEVTMRDEANPSKKSKKRKAVEAPENVVESAASTATDDDAASTPPTTDKQKKNKKRCAWPTRTATTLKTTVVTNPNNQALVSALEDLVAVATAAKSPRVKAFMKAANIIAAARDAITSGDVIKLPSSVQAANIGALVDEFLASGTMDELEMLQGVKKDATNPVNQALADGLVDLANDGLEDRKTFWRLAQAVVASDDEITSAAAVAASFKIQFATIIDRFLKTGVMKRLAKGTRILAEWTLLDDVKATYPKNQTLAAALIELGKLGSNKSVECKSHRAMARRVLAADKMVMSAADVTLGGRDTAQYLAVIDEFRTTKTIKRTDELRAAHYDNL